MTTMELTDTNSAAIAAEFVRLRRAAGSPAMGMVMTLLVVAEAEHAEAAVISARQAAQEHPARVLGVVVEAKRGHGQVDATVGIGDGWGGESALIRLTGEVAKHPASVVLPLLLPDSPVVVWWPGKAPADPAADPIGRLAQRRITDAAAGRRPTAAMRAACASYTRGNTDLAWTRLTPWRALLAAALDQQPSSVSRVSEVGVVAERANPSADLLARWLGDRLHAKVTRRTSEGPGITEVTLTTAAGDLRIARPDGRLATLSTPGRPDRPIALKRRSVPELLNEELRRLDEDEIYAATARSLAVAASTSRTTTDRRGTTK